MDGRLRGGRESGIGCQPGIKLRRGDIFPIFEDLLSPVDFERYAELSVKIAMRDISHLLELNKTKELGKKLSGLYGGM